MSDLVPEGWSYDQLGDYISESVAGEWGIEATGDANDIPVLRSTNFTASGIIDYSKLAYRNIDERKRLAKSLKFGDIVLEKSGGSPTQPVGRVVYFDKYKPFLFSNFTQKLSPVDTCDSKFLFYKLYSEYQNGTVLKFQQQTTGIINFQLAEYLGYKSAFPPLPEQQKIATILTSVDTVIEKTRAQIDKLKDLKTGMMQELLTKGIGHTEFKDSPVGRIPASWEVKTLGDVFALSSGSTPSRSIPEYYCSSLNAHSWVKTLDLSDGLVFKTDEKITDQAIQNSSCKVYPIGTALVAMYGGWNQIGRSGLLAIPAATNQAICALLSKGIVEGSYANYWLASERYRWKSIAASSRKDPNITKQDVSDFLITVPPLDEQKKIVIRLDNATELVDKKIKQLSFYTWRSQGPSATNPLVFSF